MIVGVHAVTAPCPQCQTVALKIDWRDKYIPSGVFGVKYIKWPWTVCEKCGWESEGKSGKDK